MTTVLWLPIDDAEPFVCVRVSCIPARLEVLP